MAAGMKQHDCTVLTAAGHHRSLRCVCSQSYGDEQRYVDKPAYIHDVICRPYTDAGPLLWGQGCDLFIFSARILRLIPHP